MKKIIIQIAPVLAAFIIGALLGVIHSIKYTASNRECISLQLAASTYMHLEKGKLDVAKKNLIAGVACHVQGYKDYEENALSIAFDSLKHPFSYNTAKTFTWTEKWLGSSIDELRDYHRDYIKMKAKAEQGRDTDASQK